MSHGILGVLRASTRQRLTRMLATSALAGSFLAQVAPAADSSDPIALQEVVVTATRRAETLRDVPLEVSVLQPDRLAAQGATDLGDYLYQVPGVNYAKTGGAGNGDVTIRGVTTGALSTPMVGTYIDDVPIGSSSRFAHGTDAFDDSLLDLQRIEVLKGPQGTLYGASSMGGTLRYITEGPRLNESAGSVLLKADTSRDWKFGYTAGGVWNLPLSDTTALRVGAIQNDTAGYIDATGAAGGKDTNGERSQSARAAFLYAPTDPLRVTLSAQVKELREDGLSFVDYDLKGEPVINAHTRANLRDPEPQDQKSQLYSAKLQYSLGWAEFTSITAYQAENNHQTGDFGTIYGLLGPLFGLPSITHAVSTLEDDLRKWTQELRLVSATGRRFDWIAGVFLNRESAVLSQAIAQTYGNGTPAVPLLFGPGAGFSSTFKEAALYATANYRLTDALTLTAGARGTHNEQDVTQVNGGLLAPGANSREKNSESPVTYLGAAKYQINDTNNVYARAASGYRAGGPNLGLLNPVTHLPLTNSPVYRSDSLWSYEVGYKSTLLERRLDIDLSVYDIQWKNIQQVIFEGGSTAIGNFGHARIRGADLALNVRPVRQLQLGASMTWLDAKLQTDSPVGLQALAGSELPNSAKFTANLDARYDFVVSAAATAFVRLDELFEGQRHSGYDRPSSGFISSPNFILPAFRQTDLSAGVDFTKYTVTAFIRNVTNTEGLLSAQTNQVPFGGTAWATLVQPRTVGVTFNARL